MKKLLVGMLIFTLCIMGTACGNKEVSADGEKEVLKELPKASVDAESMFGVDKNINIGTIDEWVHRDDVAYVDVRMLLDPGDYEKIGGDPVLSGTVEGFEVVPYPFLANLTGLPPEVAASQYNGDTLFTLTWDADGNIDNVQANFEESEMIIKDLFPEDRAIFLMCGGGGYWQYDGQKKVHVRVSYGENNAKEYNALHRLNYRLIDFGQLTPKN